MAKFDDGAIIELISSEAHKYQQMAENFAKSRFLLASIEYGQNEDEAQALEKIADGIKCTISSVSTGLTLDIDFDNNDAGHYLDVIQGGMGAPVTGGEGGFVHNPDGSTETSKVPPELWGNPIPEFAKQGSDVLGEVRMMLQQLFADEVRNIVQEQKPQIATLVKNYLVAELNSIMTK